jgi:hypothetical protein
MRTQAFTALALPARAAVHAAGWLLRTIKPQGAMVSAAVVLVVGILLVGLPAKPASGQQLPTVAPLVPQADSGRLASNLALDVAFQIQFTKPMNEGTVESAITIEPRIDVDYRWDPTGQILALAPKPHWEARTTYTVDISGSAADQEGIGLATPIHTSFASGELTAGVISATKVIGTEAAPTTTFQVTFTRPVKLATILTRLGISPQVDVSIAGDDPIDQTSQVFTLTPKEPLQTDWNYFVSMSDGGTDSSGSPLQPVEPFRIKTLAAPAVTFTPQDGTNVYDLNQPITLQFTQPMDQKSVQSALQVLGNGRAVSGRFHWSDDSTSVTFSPKKSFFVGMRVTVKLSTVARSTSGLHITAARTSVFHITYAPRRIYQTNIPWTGAHASSTSPWYGSEVYYLNLMNCTRTGKWVTQSGACSTATRHTKPAQSPLRLSAAISNKVSRPYASKMADLRVLTHYLNGTTPASRMAAAGFPGGGGENIASPGNSGQTGMIAIEIFYQNESGLRGPNHYTNIMNPAYRECGIGVWVSRSVRVSIDFY